MKLWGRFFLFYLALFICLALGRDKLQAAREVGFVRRQPGDDDDKPPKQSTKEA